MDKRKEIFLKYGISEELADKLVEHGFTKSKINKSSKKELSKLFTEVEVNEMNLKLVRQPITNTVYERLIKETELHCPFCWNISEEKPIIIHHIDPYNETQDNSYNNLIVLCLNHHGEAHTKREISQNNFSRERLLIKKAEWIVVLREYKAGKRPAPGKETEILKRKGNIEIFQNIDGTIKKKFKKMHFVEDFKTYFTGIEDLIQNKIFEISNHVVKSDDVIVVNNNTFGVKIGITAQKIIIEQDLKNKIYEYSQKINISISETFFNLGHLYKVSSSFLFGVDNLSGTDEEKEKYSMINNLYEIIIFFEELQEYLLRFSEYVRIDLILSNTGNAVDEDISVDLIFERGTIIVPNEFPIPGQNSIDEIDKIIEYLLSIKCTYEIEDFPNRRPIPMRPYLPVTPFSTKTDEELYIEKRDDFQEKIQNIFCDYQFHHNKNETTISFSQTYLKHNTSNNFPAVILLHNSVKCIQYLIRTRNLSEKITGKICFEE